MFMLVVQIMYFCGKGGYVQTWTQTRTWIQTAMEIMHDWKPYADIQHAEFALTLQIDQAQLNGCAQERIQSRNVEGGGHIGTYATDN